MLNRIDIENNTEKMAFEKRLGVGERRVEVGQRSASLSR